MQNNWKNIFKSYLSKISKGRFKSKEQKYIKLLYESRQAVIKIFNDYYSIVFETQHKIKYGDENSKILKTKTTKY